MSEELIVDFLFESLNMKTPEQLMRCVGKLPDSVLISLGVLTDKLSEGLSEVILEEMSIRWYEEKKKWNTHHANENVHS